MSVIEISTEQARRFLVSHLGLGAYERARGAAGVRAVLERLRAIQLDPLDAIGTNADLVAMARVRGLRRADVYRHLLPAHAFEHFFKERCLVHADAFPHYRDRMVETPWWRSGERQKRVDAATLEAVLAEVRARGPIAASALADRGRVEALDWSGWRGTGKAAKMALEVLWTRCDVIVTERRGRDKIYDVPSRALPKQHRRKAKDEFARWAVLERVQAAGLLTQSATPEWSMLREVRGGPVPDQLVEEGRLERVRVHGRPTIYLAPAGFLERPRARIDASMRILGPLDPLLWNRVLVRQVFDFDYVWEVYKPASQRRWGWYVCPLLQRGRLVGRIEARVEGETLVVQRVWPEQGVRLDEDALRVCLERHAEACGASAVKRI